MHQIMWHATIQGLRESDRRPPQPDSPPAANNLEHLPGPAQNPTQGIMMSIISGSTKGMPTAPDLGKSAMKNTPIGNGSRPTPSKYPIETSSPEDPHTRGADVPGSLK